MQRRSVRVSIKEKNERMKVIIYITGGISGNRILLNAIPSNGYKDMSYNGFEIPFNTKKEATKALSEARIKLMEDKEDWNNSNASYMRGVSLHYDASKARILRE
jgi:hypothetical protein